MIRILLSFILGSILLIYGVNMMTKGMERLNVIKIEKLLSRYNNSILLPFFLSIIITGILQSSTAVMLLTVGLVDAGILTLYPALGIVYGCNIGTTVTAQLLSFNLATYAEIIILVGLCIMLLNKYLVLHSTRYNTKQRSNKININLQKVTDKKTGMTNKQKPSIYSYIKGISFLGTILFGLGVLLFGIKTLHLGASYIQNNEQINNVVAYCGNNLVLSFIAGIILTLLVHSSSATVGLSIALYASELISLPCAIAFMLGDNIGTCITAQIAAVSSGASAKKIAFFHTFYNLICAIPALLFIKPFSNFVVAYTSLLNQHSGFLIANAHAIFNILSATAFIPLTIVWYKKNSLRSFTTYK